MKPKPRGMHVYPVFGNGDQKSSLPPLAALWRSRSFKSRSIFPRKNGARASSHRKEKKTLNAKDHHRIREMVGDNNFAKTICSICYEDLKPIVEDLQSITICGHVFHELCLQQWFEYCANSPKKYNCPVCKQKCVASNAGRLYFQSVGDQCCAVPQEPVDQEENAGVLRGEVKRLAAKVSGLTSVVEQQAKELREVNEELCICKDQTKKELALKNEALREKASNQRKLDSKYEELSKSKLECSRLEQRNMALAKELAVLKLVSDLDLEQNEIVKLASLGNEAKTQDTIDNLSRSLASHKKNYKELMAKCNLLGRGEAHLQKKLEKAKEKISKLKMRIQELETAAEAKDNEVLRSLKSSKKMSPRSVILNVDDCSNTLIAKKSLAENQMEQSFVPVNRTNVDSSERSPAKKTEDISSVSPIASNHTRVGKTIEKERRVTFIDEDAPKASVSVHKLSNLDLQNQNGENAIQEFAPLSKTVSDINGEPIVESVTKRMFNIRRETPSSLSLSEQGNICFSGGVLGPDGTRWHLGKWCKRGRMTGSVAAAHGSTANSGDLIAVGADGRGGRIKVMRSMNQPSLEDKESSGSAKRLKNGAKTNSLQSKGCLQIEHFFGKASQ
ncbi:hypothetical protein SLA2020_511440 [Shorea laevis]